MEAKEKLASLKRRAFFHFKSHSYEVPSSLDLSTHCSTTIHETNNNNDRMYGKVETSDNQSDFSLLGKNLSLPRTG